MPGVNILQIEQALTRIRPYVACSAVKSSVSLHKRLGMETFLKLENLNLAGSFKIRGAVNALLQVPPEQLQRGVVAASAGNHAQGVAYTCRLLGVKATIFMPLRSPLVKAAATRELGAEVRLIGMSYDEAFQAAVDFQKTDGGLLLHGFHDPRVICGQGTIGLELLDQIPNLGMVIGSIGGGGMMAGVAMAIKARRPDITLIGVQSVAFPAMHRSFREHRLVSCASGSTIADGIAIKEPSALTFSIIEQCVDDIILVTEEEIASAVMNLMEWEHMLAEGAGAASLAGLLKLSPEILTKHSGQAVACIISGGNIDVNLLKRIIPSGLKYSGRLFRLAIRIQDRPGRLAELLNTISSTGANLQDVHHNRLFGAVSYEDVEVQLDLETIDQAHQEQVMDALSKERFKFAKLD